jgi:hypothetical protein
MYGDAETMVSDIFKMLLLSSRWLLPLLMWSCCSCGENRAVDTRFIAAFPVSASKFHRSIGRAVVVTSYRDECMAHMTRKLIKTPLQAELLNSFQSVIINMVIHGTIHLSIRVYVPHVSWNSAIAEISETNMASVYINTIFIFFPAFDITTIFIFFPAFGLASSSRCNAARAEWR